MNNKKSSDKTYPVRNFNVSKLNGLLPMRAHNYCTLHGLNVCAMQCTSCYIGYLRYIIQAVKLVVRMKDQRFISFSN